MGVCGAYEERGKKRKKFINKVLLHSRYVGTNGGNGGGEQPLYYDEREKVRGRSVNPQNCRGSERRDQMPPSPRYGPPSASVSDIMMRGGDARYRNGYRNDRHTIDRDRFPKYNEPCDYEYDDDIEQQPTHLSRRDRMRERERERERELGPSSPKQNRHLMRYSEDRQMGTSPRYQRAGRKS